MKRSALHLLDLVSTDEEKRPLPPIPLEVWSEILSHLRYGDLMLRCAPVCKEWYEESFMCVRSLFPSEMSGIHDAILGKMKNLDELILFQTYAYMKHQITNKGIESLVNLKKLVINGQSPINDEGVKKLTGLTRFTFSPLTNITDEGIKGLTNLVYLGTATQDKRRLTNEGLKGLTNLTSLHLMQNRVIDDECIAKLTGLRQLGLENNERITGQCFSALTLLEDLNLSGSPCCIQARFLLSSTLANSLTSLDLSKHGREENDEHVICDEHVGHLTRLSKLKLDMNFYITDKSLSSLHSLRKLKLGRNVSITNKSIMSLTGLQNLSVVTGIKGMPLNPDALSTRHGLVIKKTQIPAPIGTMRVIIINRNHAV